MSECALSQPHIPKVHDGIVILQWDGVVRGALPDRSRTCGSHSPFVCHSCERYGWKQLAAFPGCWRRKPVGGLTSLYKTTLQSLSLPPYLQWRRIDKTKTPREKTGALRNPNHGFHRCFYATGFFSLFNSSTSSASVARRSAYASCWWMLSSFVCLMVTTESPAR